METCIFCKIAHHEISSKIIYEDDICIAFLDLSQTTDGHTLVIPKKHFTNFLEVDANTLMHLTTVTQKLANKIVTKLDAKGVNILTNAGTVAGQTILHFHFHIIPRYQEDEDITITFTDRNAIVDLEKIYTTITK